MTITGGRRARFIRQSIYDYLYDSLDQLGWFDPGIDQADAAVRRHKTITFPGITETNEEKIPLNRLALNDEDSISLEFELGSNGVERRWTFWVDFYAENDDVGKGVIYDVEEILGGRMSDVGAIAPRIPVYDYLLATPAVFTHVQIETPVVDRAHDFPRPYQKHWYACRFTVVDAYIDGADELDP